MPPYSVVAVSFTSHGQSMARLITLLEQHLERMPPTVVTQATTWWETVLALVKLARMMCGPKQQATKLAVSILIGCMMLI